MDYLSIALSLTAVLVALYYYSTRKLSFFKDHEIPHLPPTPLFGNLGSMFAMRSTLYDLLKKMYFMNTEAKYIGVYEFQTPVIMIRDLDLIKSITMKNFEHFADHRVLVQKELDPMFSKMLFSMTGEEWKEHRNMLSPAFTSSKIKNMFQLMSRCAVRFSNYISKLPESERETDMKALLSKYTNDVIASCVYGISVDSIKEPKNVFYVYGRIGTMFTTFKKSMFLIINRNLPWIAKLFRLKMLEGYVEKFFAEIALNEIETRQRNGIHRSDMLQMFIDTNNKKESGKGMSAESMAYHAFSFFFGGFDTVVSQTCFVAHLLAENPDCQVRLQQEIDEALEQNDGQLSYDIIQNMKYLDAVINETMRMYPIAVFVDRLCLKDFDLPPTLPGSKPFTIKQGMNIWVPIIPIQIDPKYYENPETFDPDRFLEDGKKIINSGAFMPFGIGPRMCIGNRFALIEMKVLLCHILATCSFKVGSQTTTPLQLQKGSYNLTMQNGFFLKIEPRKNPYYSTEVSEVNGIANGGVNGVAKSVN
ncbi:Cytochrome P450 9e2 [Eufriesea mexicana]|uniref:Cytochrome P450 9e2 n=1 Tax=Eufriesea mexicana TaxID=516756 RepID=A0A310SEM1_9HYME|nr:PREDICTED: cytochrome P450 9e2-like [Eufriesea mexicana]OAD56184.1 Cytochrome P450 9e2 [Eufriesea mexicana]